MRTIPSAADVGCARLVERLYDDDVRRTSAAGLGPPADLRDHLEACLACRAEWEAAQEDAFRLREALEDAPPPHLRRAIAAAWTRSPAALLRTIDWAAALSWAGAAGALAVGSVLALSRLPWIWAAAAFAMVATAAFAAQLMAAALADGASNRA
jgi:hypothetical protein